MLWNSDEAVPASRTAISALPSDSVRTAIEITGLSLLLVLVLRFSWIGFLASDDWSYLTAAEGWVEQSPYVGHNHWALRHTLVLPLALVVRDVGVTEFTLTLPTLSYFCAVLVLTYWAVRQLFGRTPAVVTTGLLILTPLFAEQATIAGVDIVEMFFVVLSLWLFYRATLGGPAQRLLIAAGVAAGFAWLSRETTIGLLTFYGLLFLLHRAERSSATCSRHSSSTGFCLRLLDASFSPKTVMSSYTSPPTRGRRCASQHPDAILGISSRPPLQRCASSDGTGRSQVGGTCGYSLTGSRRGV